MKLINQKNGFDLKSYYVIFFELGLIGSLSILLIATNIKLSPEKGDYYVPPADQEIVQMKEVVQTKQQKTPPPPPPPQVPVEVPNDFVVEDTEINFSSELDLDDPIEIPQEIEHETAPGQQEEEEEIFVVVEHYPELVGGIASLHQKIEYPKEALRAGIDGLVVVQFIVTEKGTVRDPVVIRGIGGGCDEEAVRVVKNATFKPGLQRGKAVKVRYSLPIHFKLRR